MKSLTGNIFFPHKWKSLQTDEKQQWKQIYYDKRPTTKPVNVIRGGDIKSVKGAKEDSWTIIGTMHDTMFRRNEVYSTIKRRHMQPWIASSVGEPPNPDIQPLSNRLKAVLIMNSFWDLSLQAQSWTLFYF